MASNQAIFPASPTAATTSSGATGPASAAAAEAGSAGTSAGAPLVGDFMESLESIQSIEQVLGDGDDAPAKYGGDDGADVENKPTYVDYLKSPMVTILVGSPPSETALSAHLMLLRASPWLAEVCAEYSADTPVGERIVHLPDDSLDAVAAFLEYLYTKEYKPRLIAGPSGTPDDLILEDVGDSDVDDHGDNLLKHARVYTLAERLRLPELKHLAHSKIHRINSTAKGELRYAKFVYENTAKGDDTLRKPIASFWAHRSHVLRHEAEEEFRSMVLEFPQFAYDILSIVLDQKEKSRERGRDHSKPRAAIGAPATDDDMAVAPTKTPRTGRKRPRTSTIF